MPRRRRVWTGHHAIAKFGHCAQSPSRPDAVSDLSPNIWSGLDGDEHSGTLSTVMAGCPTSAAITAVLHVSLVMYTDMYTSMTRAMYAITAGICRLRSRSLIAH